MRMRNQVLGCFLPELCYKSKFTSRYFLVKIIKPHIYQISHSNLGVLLWARTKWVLVSFCFIAISPCALAYIFSMWLLLIICLKISMKISLSLISEFSFQIYISWKRSLPKAYCYMLPLVLCFFLLPHLLCVLILVRMGPLLFSFASVPFLLINYPTIFHLSEHCSIPDCFIWK